MATVTINESNITNINSPSFYKCSINDLSPYNYILWAVYEVNTSLPVNSAFSWSGGTIQLTPPSSYNVGIIGSSYLYPSPFVTSAFLNSTSPYIFNKTGNNSYQFLLPTTDNSGYLTTASYSNNASISNYYSEGLILIAFHFTNNVYMYDDNVFIFDYTEKLISFDTTGTTNIMPQGMTYESNSFKPSNKSSAGNSSLYLNSCATYIGRGKLIDPEDPNDGGGSSAGGGGGGEDNIGGTPHKEGEIPSISALDSGLMTLYNPTVAQLQSLGQFLWSDQFSLDNFKKLFNDPFDTLLGLSIVPVSPTVSGTHNILFGNLDSGVSANVIANQFVSVDCGTLTLNEVWKGALDYSPSTQVSIYLPFIGTRQLNTNDVMGSVLHLYYRFDVLTGSCVAEITINHSAQGNKSSGFSYNTDMGSVYTFVGQCGVNIPLASQDYTNTIRAAIGAVGMAAGVGASVATGNPAIGVASVLTQSANIGMQANTPTVERSGHLSGSGALLSSYEPCLFVTRPHQCKPQKYYALRGIPSQVYVSKLNKATGFFQIADVQNIHCSGATDSELTEIKTKLTQGVFVTTWPSDLSGSSTLDVQLYNNTSAVNRIDKSLTGIRSGDNALDGTFRDSVNIDRPTIRLRINDISDLKHANYMYIAMFERYYFINSITSVRNNIVEIQGHIDVLKTYGYQIGQNTAILSRSSQAGSSGYGNTYLDDNLLATYQDTYNVSYPWGYTFSHDNDSLILAVAGASVSSSE